MSCEGAGRTEISPSRAGAQLREPRTPGRRAPRPLWLPVGWLSGSGISRNGVWLSFLYRIWQFRVPAVNVEKPLSCSRQLTVELTCAASLHEQLSPADVRDLNFSFPKPRITNTVLSGPGMSQQRRFIAEGLCLAWLFYVTKHFWLVMTTLKHEISFCSLSGQK